MFGRLISVATFLSVDSLSRTSPITVADGFSESWRRNSNYFTTLAETSRRAPPRISFLLLCREKLR